MALSSPREVPSLAHQFAETPTLPPVSPSAPFSEPGMMGHPSETTTIGSFANALHRHRALAVVLFLLVLVPVLAYAVKRTPTYPATARILVNPLPSDDTTFLGLPLLRDTGDSTLTMQTAATLIDSQPAAALTASALGRPWTARRVRAVVSVQPEGDSEILDITAAASRPSEAARIATTFARAALAARASALRPVVAQAITAATQQLGSIRSSSSNLAGAEIQQNLSQLQSLRDGHDPTLSLSEAAVVPTASSGLSTSLTLALGLIGALALAAAGPVLVEIVRKPRLDDDQQLSAMIPGPIMARVPTLPRSFRSARGSSLSHPLPPAVGEALRGLRIILDLTPGRHRSILITSAFHGDGKTTTAVNLAREIAESGSEVLLIDVDMRKPDIGKRLNLQPVLPLSETVLDPKPLSYAVSPPEFPNLRVLTTYAEPDFASLDRVADELPAVLEKALEQAEFVILDAPPLGEVADVMRFVGAVDDVLLVSRLGQTPLGALQVAREMLARTSRQAVGHVIVGSSPQSGGYGYYYHTETSPSVRDRGTDVRLVPLEREESA